MNISNADQNKAPRKRRKTVNRTGIERVSDQVPHDAWIAFCCISCGEFQTFRQGNILLTPEEALHTANWICQKCGFIHAQTTPLPNWKNWSSTARKLGRENFWQGFFRIHTEHPESYWKFCTACGRVQPFHAFSKHSGFGILERQMECRACKGAINAVLNPKRTKEQLHEGSRRRRIAEALIEGENTAPSFAELFERFNSRCFKTGQKLDILKRNTWEIDHILPATYLYPLTKENACLLSKSANQNKKSQWPSKFYTSTELIELAKLTGANLDLLAAKNPTVNPHIDVNACVKRFLTVRERTDLQKRIRELVALLKDYDLLSKLSTDNRRLLGL